MFVALPYTDAELAVTKEDSNFCDILDLSRNLKCLLNVYLYYFDDEMYELCKIEKTLFSKFIHFFIPTLMLILYSRGHILFQ